MRNVLLGLIVTILGLGGAGCGNVSTGGAANGAGQAERQSMAEPIMLQEPGGLRAAVLAGGCFWCTEAVFEQLEGVTEVVSGYAGGTAEAADYKKVSSGSTDHAEVIKVVYDPGKITYDELLKVFFTVAHDPTQLNKQGPDWGRQYRSAVFYQSPEEKAAAEAYIRKLEEQKVYDKPIVTTLEPLAGFYPAEQYHQDYVRHNPDNPYVRYNALPKVDKVRDRFADRVK